MAVLLPILLMIFACVIIWRASEGFETASEFLGRNLSDGVRGATINAIGSSMPELFTTLFFLFFVTNHSGHSGDGFAGGIGTSAGSALFNSMIIPALVILVVVSLGVVRSIEVSKKVVWRDGIALLIAEVVLVFLLVGDTLYAWHGLVLMSMYLVYVLYMFATMEKKRWEKPEGTESFELNLPRMGVVQALFTLNLNVLFVGKGILRTGRAWLLLLSATAIIALASALLVESCENLGEALGVRVYFIAVVLASAATSVPDTILSIRDGLKGKYDDSLSNAWGSNIFDICFALGFPLFLFTLIKGPVTMSPETISDVGQLRILLVLLTLASFLVFVVRPRMGRMHGYVLLGLYGLFTLYIFAVAYQYPFIQPFSGWLEALYLEVSSWVGS